MVLKQMQKNSIFLLLSFVDRQLKIIGSAINASIEEVLLVVKIDSDLTVKEHGTSICSRPYQNVHALTKVSKNMSLQKRRIP